jgi:putative membrane protein
MNDRHRDYLKVLAAAFAVVFVAAGISPKHRMDWVLENTLVALAIPVLIAIYRKLPFSRLSWTLVFIFLCLHELGAHYTYSEVPYDDWWRRLTGHTWNEMFGWQRNHFDRLIHFAYGLLLAYPVREVFLSLAHVRGFWSYFLPLDLTISSSAIYELIEWGAAEVFGGETAQAYVGAQGDVWDAQKDMLLAATGALISMSGTALINWRCQRDFARQWAESLAVKPPANK